MIEYPAMNYIRNHWQGKQSLFWTFWVNVVALRVVILFFERFTHPHFTEQSGAAIAATALYFAVFQVIVLVWQARGLIRACDRYLAALGSHLTVLAAQLGLGICLIATLVYVAGAAQSLFADPQKTQINRSLKKQSLLGDYTLNITDGGTRIHVAGDFRVGLGADLAALLARHPRVTAIVLSSNGGRVAEGRSIARLIEKRRLDTYVFDDCKSACTTAFIGGVKRTLGETGRLGFHQFSLDAVYMSPYVDSKSQQKIDLDFYSLQKIDPGFLKKVFQASPHDIWYPDADELVAAGVVHEIEAAK